MAAVASKLVKIVASSFDAATRPGDMVARMGTAVGRDGCKVGALSRW